MPADREDALISDGTHIAHARRKGDGWEIVASNDIVRDKVTHWMRMPAPPENK